MLGHIGSITFYPQCSIRANIIEFFFNTLLLRASVDSSVHIVNQGTTLCGESPERKGSNNHGPELESGYHSLLFLTASA